MKPMHLRIFNDAGMNEFRNRWETASETRSELVVSDMIESDNWTEVVSKEPIVKFTEFASRRDCGDFFYALLNQEGQLSSKPSLSPSSSVELWTWLSAVWSPWLQQKDGKKLSLSNGTLGESSRWLFEPNSRRRYYRHLLAGPYLIVAANIDNPSRAQILLYNDVVTPNTRWVETICGSEDFHFNKVLLETLSSNLLDSKSGQPTREAKALTRRKSHFAKKGQEETGTIDRFTQVYNQLTRTWDLHVTSPKRLEELFGTEFHSFFNRS